VQDSTVGRGAEIGEGSLLENCVVGVGARIGRRARVADSIIGPGASLGDDAAVIDHSIVGAGAHVDAGSALAGSRIELSATAG
jgi:NDP-sugar pyrophosphorylase family protein